MSLKRVLVPVKRVVDYAVKVRVRSDGTGVETNNVKMSMNPFDEIAVEEAIRIKEGGKASEVVAVSIGPKQCQETLRTAMALGADRSIHVVTDETVQPLGVAKLLKEIVDRECPELILCGKQAIDDDSCQTSQLLAGLLDSSQAMFASKITIDDEGKSVTVAREIDGGMETLKLTFPAVVSTDLRLNEPRFAKLQNIMKARKKPIEELTVEELGVDIEPRIETLKVEEPPVRKSGVKLESVTELVQKLKDDGVL